MGHGADGLHVRLPPGSNRSVGVIIGLASKQATVRGHVRPHIPGWVVEEAFDTRVRQAKRLSHDIGRRVRGWGGLGWASSFTEARRDAGRGMG